MIPRILRRHRVVKALYSVGLLPRIQQVEFDGGARAWVNLEDAEARAVYCTGHYWPEIHHIAAGYIDRGHVLDVGANWGLVSLGIQRLRPEATFHLFEANPRIVEQLRRSQGPRLIVNHCCVTDRPGASRFQADADMWGQSHMANVGERVPNLVLDDYIVARRIDRVDFLKMDIEGWEPLALRGAERSLRAGIIRAAFIEVARDTYRRVDETPEGVVDFLQDCGMRCYWPPTSRQPAKPFPEDFQTGDILALRCP